MLDPEDELRIKALVREAMKEALADTIKSALDIDVDDTDDRREMRKDLSFVRAQREFYAAAVRHGFLTALGIIAVGIAAAVWSAIRVGIAK